MPEGTITLRGESLEELPPDPGEARLRALLPHRPGMLRLVMIASEDGRAAGPDGSSRSLTSPADQRLLTALRSVCDVILVGAQTARRERYTDLALSEELTAARVAQGLRPQVDIAVVTHGGILPPALTPAHTWVITHSGSPALTRLGPEWRDRTIVAGLDDVSPRTAIRELAARGLQRPLCEGGPALATRLLARGLVDEYCFAVSAARGGPQAPATPPVPPQMTAGQELAADGWSMVRWIRR